MGAFKGQLAVITGASSGVGKAIAVSLAAKGATLCLVGRDAQALKAVAESTEASSHMLCYSADLTVDREIQELAAYLQREFPSVDLLVHSAGVYARGPLAAAPVEDFDRQYRVNTHAPYVLTQALLPMLRSSRGQIVFINSTTGLSARAGMAQYSATKHALKAIADSLREEVNGDGLRILSIFLGRTATPMQKAIHKMEGRLYEPDCLIQPEDVARLIMAAVSLPRTAEVTDISIRPMIKGAAPQVQLNRLEINASNSHLVSQLTV